MRDPYSKDWALRVAAFCLAALTASGTAFGRGSGWGDRVRGLSFVVMTIWRGVCLGFDDQNFQNLPGRCEFVPQHSTYMTYLLIS